MPKTLTWSWAEPDPYDEAKCKMQIMRLYKLAERIAKSQQAAATE